MGSFSCFLFTALCLSGFHHALAVDKSGCSSPRLPRHLGIVWTSRPPTSKFEESFPEGIVIGFACDAGYTLFGSENATCSNGKWLEYETKCFLEVAEGSRCHMSAQADEFASAHLAADGNPQTCVSFSPNEKQLSWSVDTIQAFRVRVVTILTQFSLPNSTIEIRVGSHHPSTGSKFNKLCTRQELSGHEGNERQFVCENDSAVGRYVSILIVEPGDNHVSFCEVNVYSDSGLSIDDACPSKSRLVPETARYIFENKCVQFLGQNTHDNASLLCELHGGSLVTPTSREFQSFLDYHVLKFFETSYEQAILSFWVDAQRVNGSDSWVDGSDTKIRGVQIKSDTDAECLVSESRSWHSEPCDREHQVICVSPPLTCGNPGLPEHSSVRERVKLLVNQSSFFSCEPGFQANLDTITCFSDGSLSEEPLCEAEGAIELSFSSKISNFLRSFSIFANLSAKAFRIVLIALGVVSATLLSALSACCFCLCQRRQAKKLFRFSLADF